MEKETYSSVRNQPMQAKLDVVPQNIREATEVAKSIPESVIGFFALKNVIDLINPDFKNLEKDFKQHKIQLVIEIANLEYGFAKNTENKKLFYNSLLEKFSRL